MAVELHIQGRVYVLADQHEGEPLTLFRADALITDLLARDWAAQRDGDRHTVGDLEGQARDVLDDPRPYEGAIAFELLEGGVAVFRITDTTDWVLVDPTATLDG